MITIITGPMKSGKTEKMLSIYNINKLMNKQCIIFTPTIDNRKERSIQNSIKIKYLNDLWDYDFDIAFIDEFQFFYNNIDAILRLNNRGKDFYISCLNLTSENKPFEICESIFPYADNIIILKAVCDKCYKYNATRTYCKVNKQDDILVGDDIYLSLCLNCYNNMAKTN